MTIDEMQKAKAALQEKIAAELRGFVEKTGVEICDVRLDPQYSIGRRLPVAYLVRIEARL